MNAYQGPFPALCSAVPDALSVAATLKNDHGFRVATLVDRAVTLQSLRAIFHWALPRVLGANGRLLVYFAGHGVVQASERGPAGYLLPSDARGDDPSTFFSMDELHDALLALPCHHVLLVLDCCFSGTFRWSSYRDVAPGPTRPRLALRDVALGASAPAPLPRGRWGPCLEAAAWQVLTSGSHDQPVLDALPPRGARGDGGRRSPFTDALLRGLQGAADFRRKGLVTALELYLYVRDRVERLAGRVGWHQSPQYSYLKKHGGGEFAFQVPRQAAGARSSRPPGGAGHR